MEENLKKAAKELGQDHGPNDAGRVNIRWELLYFYFRFILVNSHFTKKRNTKYPFETW